MADPQQQQTKPEAKPKTAAECRKEYEALAKQTTEMAAQRPKHIRELEARVKRELGDFDGKLDALRARKGAAAKALAEAEERERPAREAKAAAEAEAQAEQARKAKADRVKREQAERQRATEQRLRDAVG